VLPQQNYWESKSCSPIFSVLFSNILGDIRYIGNYSDCGYLAVRNSSSRQFNVSFPEKLLKVVATRGQIFSLKFTKYRLTAGLRVDPLGS